MTLAGWCRRDLERILIGIRPKTAKIAAASGVATGGAIPAEIRLKTGRGSAGLSLRPDYGQNSVRFRSQSAEFRSPALWPRGASEQNLIVSAVILLKIDRNPVKNRP